MREAGSLALVDELEKRPYLVFGRSKSKEYNRGWKELTEKLNAQKEIYKQPLHYSEWKKKWQDLLYRTRKKAGLLKKQSKEEVVPLTDLNRVERRVISLLQQISQNKNVQWVNSDLEDSLPSSPSPDPSEQSSAIMASTSLTDSSVSSNHVILQAPSTNSSVPSGHFILQTPNSTHGLSVPSGHFIVQTSNSSLGSKGSPSHIIVNAANPSVVPTGTFIIQTPPSSTDSNLPSGQILVNAPTPSSITSVASNVVVRTSPDHDQIIPEPILPDLCNTQNATSIKQEIFEIDEQENPKQKVPKNLKIVTRGLSDIYKANGKDPFHTVTSDTRYRNRKRTRRDIKEFDVLAEIEKKKLALLEEKLEIKREYLKIQERKTQIMEEQLAVSKEQLAVSKEQLAVSKQSLDPSHSFL